MTVFKSPTLEDRIAARERTAGRIAGYQRWNDLLFLHWQCDADSVQATLPPSLRVDTHDGMAYVGIVPFFMERIRPAWMPPLPWVSWFLELNVRTYVHDRDGRPGVWFYSLDCNQRLAVAIARRFFHLPYHHAKMRAQRRSGVIHYRSERRGPVSIPLDYSWQPEGEVFAAEPGSLEFFLIERYLLFSTDKKGALHVGRVRHQPYRIQRAIVSAHSSELARLAGFSFSDPPDSALCAGAVDVSIHALAPAEEPSH